MQAAGNFVGLVSTPFWTGVCDHVRGKKTVLLIRWDFDGGTSNAPINGRIFEHLWFLTAVKRQHRRGINLDCLVPTTVDRCGRWAWTPPPDDGPLCMDVLRAMRLLLLLYPGPLHPGRDRR